MTRAMLSLDILLHSRDFLSTCKEHNNFFIRPLGYSHQLDYSKLPRSLDDKESVIVYGDKPEETLWPFFSSAESPHPIECSSINVIQTSLNELRYYNSFQQDEKRLNQKMIIRSLLSFDSFNTYIGKEGKMHDSCYHITQLDLWSHEEKNPFSAGLLKRSDVPLSKTER
jgi:hypothetical protein